MQNSSIIKHRKVVMKTIRGILILLTGSFFVFQLYYELGFGSNPENWQKETRRIEGVTTLEEVKQGSLQKHGTCFHYVSSSKEECINSYYNSGRVMWMYDLKAGQSGYAEVETSYLKPLGIYKRRMENGGLVISCPTDKWVFHLPSGYSVKRVIW